jgi:hypothetical protein
VLSTQNLRVWICYAPATIINGRAIGNGRVCWSDLRPQPEQGGSSRAVGVLYCMYIRGLSGPLGVCGPPARIRASRIRSPCGRWRGGSADRPRQRKLVPGWKKRRACAPNAEPWLSASTTTSKRAPANARWRATVRHEQSGPQSAGGARWPSFIWPRRKFIFGVFAHPHACQGQADNASRRVCGLITWARGVVCLAMHVAQSRKGGGSGQEQLSVPADVGFFLVPLLSSTSGLCHG